MTRTISRRSRRVTSVALATALAGGASIAATQPAHATAEGYKPFGGKTVLVDAKAYGEAEGQIPKGPGGKVGIEVTKDNVPVHVPAGVIRFRINGNGTKVESLTASYIKAAGPIPKSRFDFLVYDKNWNYVTQFNGNREKLHNRPVGSTYINARGYRAPRGGWVCAQLYTYNKRVPGARACHMITDPSRIPAMSPLMPLLPGPTIIDGILNDSRDEASRAAHKAKNGARAATRAVGRGVDKAGRIIGRLFN